MLQGFIRSLLNKLLIYIEEYLDLRNNLQRLEEKIYTTGYGTFDKASSSSNSKPNANKMFGVSSLRFLSLSLILLLQFWLLCWIIGASAHEAGSNSEELIKTTVLVADRPISSNSKQQEDELKQTGKLRAGPDDELANAEIDTGTKRGTVCIYQGSSCAERAQGKPGKFASCNSEVEDGICMNFPTAGVVFKCASEVNLVTYPTAGCEAKRGVAQQVACVDMTLGTYFLLCCVDTGGPVGEPCVDSAHSVLSLEDQKKPTWMGGKFVKW